MDSGDSTEITENELHAALESLAQQRAELSVLQRELSDAQRALQSESHLVHTRRLEAVASAAIHVVDRSITHHVTARINPLSDAIAHGWGQFFTADGAVGLNDKGEIEFVGSNGAILTYPQLSGGQQMLATLTLRLSLVAAATNLRCVWLDEPLEHLDPTNRRPRREPACVRLTKPAHRPDCHHDI